MSSSDPHEATSRLAAKIARGATLTGAEDAELTAARASIVATIPEAREWQALEIWMHAEAEKSLVKIKTVLAQLEAKIERLERVEVGADPLADTDITREHRRK